VHRRLLRTRNSGDGRRPGAGDGGGMRGRRLRARGAAVGAGPWLAPGRQDSGVAVLGEPGLDDRGVVEGLASVVVIWRLTGNRTLSETSERTAQRAVAVSFWLLAPYVAVQAGHDLVTGSRATASPLGVALTVSSVVIMPVLGRAKHRLGVRLGSAATAGEGTQNLLCAYLAAAVLVGLVANATLGAWWLDPIIALAVAAVAVKEGREAWRGEDCC